MPFSTSERSKALNTYDIFTRVAKRPQTQEISRSDTMFHVKHNDPDIFFVKKPLIVDANMIQ